MWTILCSLALAVSPDELAAELPGARVQLDACATEGCDREEAARAAWLLALGTYVEIGVADGELSATVRVLDPALWSQLPPVLLDAATDPAGWAQRVGGAPPPSGARSSSERVAAVRSIQLHARPRIFVVSEPGSGRDYEGREGIGNTRPFKSLPPAPTDRNPTPARPRSSPLHPLLTPRRDPEDHGSRPPRPPRTHLSVPVARPRRASVPRPAFRP